VIVAAFRVAQDHQGRAGVGQHRGRDVAGVGAADLHVAVLTAGQHRRAFQRLAQAIQQGGRRAEGHAGRGGLGVQGGGHRASLIQGLGEAVHLPVSGDQRPGRQA
jgi:hypothetical protein